MAQTLNEIFAARQSCFGFRWRPIGSLLEIQPFPSNHAIAHQPDRQEAKWKDHLVVGRNRRYSWDGVEIGFEGANISIGHKRKVGIGKGGEVVVAVRAQPLTKCSDEVVVRPAADAGGFIGRDVGAVEGAERRLESSSTGQGDASLSSMASGTTGGPKDILTLFRGTTVDASCYSWQSARAVDELNNHGKTDCHMDTQNVRDLHHPGRRRRPGRAARLRRAITR